MDFYILEDDFSELNIVYKNKKPLQISNHSNHSSHKTLIAVIKNVETRGLSSRGATLLHCNNII